MNTPAVYILTNTHHTTFYTGVTSNLELRMLQHRVKHFKGFSARYNLCKLVYCEGASDMRSAIEREKYIKGKKRAFKISLIESMNPEWNDLSSCHPERSEESPQTLPRHPEASAEGSPQVVGGSFTCVQDDEREDTP